MNWISGAWATCLFELKQSLNKQRIGVSAVLILFPPVMMFFALQVGRFPGHPEFLLIMLVSLICVLSLLLWATPIVFSEIETKGWVFLASRPGGRISLYLGKYLASVLFTSIVTTLSITLSIAISPWDFESPIDALYKLSLIFLLSSGGYAAVFAFIGTLIFKRAMVIAAAYMIIWEGLIASLPAIVNQLTLRFHLQSVGILWLGFFPEDDSFGIEEYKAFYGSGPSWAYDLPAVFVLSAVFLALGCFVICFRQYSISDEV